MSTPAPGPLRRLGPRPLLLHLFLAMLRSSASIAASPASKNGWPRSSASFLEGVERLRQALSLAGGPTEQAFRRAVLAETLRQDRELIAGIAAYRRHPYQRTLPDPPVLWQEGDTRLLDYGTGRRNAPSVLFVPSLVNRAYVLDLSEESSMLRWLAASGLRPLLLDWGWPGEAERSFTLTDYIAGRLERVLMALPRRFVLVGYCMGGLLALAAALRRPERIRALALLATPWDFHAAGAERAMILARTLPLFEPLFTVGASLPTDCLQTLFAGLDPFGVAAKYRSFARLDPASARARLFVALEDWLNDGVPLAAPVARECLGGWYGANSPARLAWRVAGLPVDPTSLRMPAFIAAPGRDRIVPPESARPLATLIPGAILHTPAAGHVGMVAGSTAETSLWRPFRDWLGSL
ncbi:MAG TPA: alpha/beta fold hydrolase [Acetobacteraceae bacterium]|nr:alpha/beta fold hydrolase [Acetobacteraceae bacterium]